MVQKKKLLNIDVGVRIQQCRERCGMTQEQLAEQISRSTQFISTIERGKAGASLETIINLCEVLGTSADYLLRGLDTTAHSDYIAAKLSLLSPEQLAVVSRMADDLLSLLHADSKPVDD